eukprot:m.136227 g.136227  ORF g.136227 m.136227 type:complete len:469 (+) comp13135_c0_seq1:197-1603(+)
MIAERKVLIGVAQTTQTKQTCHNSTASNKRGVVSTPFEESVAEMGELASLDWLLNIRINCLSLGELSPSSGSKKEMRNSSSKAGSFTTITPPPPTQLLTSNSNNKRSLSSVSSWLGQSTSDLIMNTLEANVASKPNGMTCLQIVKWIAARYPFSSKKDEQVLKKAIRNELTDSPLFCRTRSAGRKTKPASNACWTLRRDITSTSLCGGKAARKMRLKNGKRTTDDVGKGQEGESEEGLDSEEGDCNKDVEKRMKKRKKSSKRRKDSKDTKHKTRRRVSPSFSSGVGSSDSDAESTSSGRSASDAFDDEFDFLDINTHVGADEVFSSSLFIHELPSTPSKKPINHCVSDNGTGKRSTPYCRNKQTLDDDIYGSTNPDAWVVDSVPLDDPFSIFTQELDAQQHLLADEGLYIMPPTTHMDDDLTVYGQSLNASFNGTLLYESSASFPTAPNNNSSVSSASLQQEIDILSF